MPGASSKIPAEPDFNYLKTDAGNFLWCGSNRCERWILWLTPVATAASCAPLTVWQGPGTTVGELGSVCEMAVAAMAVPSSHPSRVHQSFRALQSVQEAIDRGIAEAAFDAHFEFFGPTAVELVYARPRRLLRKNHRAW